MVNDKYATSSIHRAFHIGKMGFGIAGSYLGYQVQNHFLNPSHKEQNKKSFKQKSARQIRNELGYLHGPIMKLGQTLSMQSQLISEEMIEQLSELQMNAPAMHPTLMRTQFKNSMGNYPEEIFKEFEMEPFAAASFGQVHRAVTTSGDKVAVKIQYPAIRQAVKNDFSALRSATLPFRLTKHVTQEMLQEIERGIVEETDYKNEIRNIEFFKSHLNTLDYIRVPKVYKKYSSEKVLTMEFMPGYYLNSFLQTNPGQSARDQLGSRLFELFHYQFYKLSVIHGDPHPGNYLYNDDGTISLIDYGCVKYFPATIAETLRNLMEDISIQGNWKSSQLLEFIFGEKTDPLDSKQQLFLNALDEFCGFLYPVETKPVDFGAPVIFKKMANMWNQVVTTKTTKPDFFFLKRAELGMYNVLHQLGARVYTSQIVKQIINR